jgi:CHAD domain-containing protein
MQGSMTASPIEQLREQAKRLEAALAVGVATPTTKAVHELRSATRRLEAQIDLLKMVHGLPTYKPEANKLLRRLDLLRRKAGRVRDCDVQTKLLMDEEHAIASAVEAPGDLDKTKSKLTKRIDKERQRQEKKLVAEVERQLPKLTRDTEKLLAALKAEEARTVPVADLLDPVMRQMDRLLRSREHGEERLHDLRKAAKRARYQCESMPGTQAAAMAKRFEELQDAGGSWHDMLDLATTCHEEFGAEHPLSRVLEHLRDARLDEYLANIDDLRNGQTLCARAKRKPPQRAAAASRTTSKEESAIR